MRAVFLLLLMTACAASAVAADSGLELSRATPLRLSFGNDRREFTLDDVRADTLIVLEKDGGPQQSVPLRDIQALDIRVQSTRSRGAGKGFAVGFVAGFVTGAVIGYATGEDEPCSGQEWCSPTPESGAILGAAVFGATGALLGTLIGAAYPGTHWQSVDLPVHIEMRANEIDLSYTVLGRRRGNLPF
jgi:hypothetical protein